MAEAADLEKFNSQLRIIKAANNRQGAHIRMIFFCEEGFYTISLWVGDVLYTPFRIGWPSQ